MEPRPGRAGGSSGEVTGDPRYSSFYPTTRVLRTLESVAASVSLRKPVLLVGETGTGKMASLQFLAASF